MFECRMTEIQTMPKSEWKGIQISDKLGLIYSKRLKSEQVSEIRIHIVAQTEQNVWISDTYVIA